MNSPTTDVVSVSAVVPVPQAEAFRMFTECIGDWYRIDAGTVPDPTRTVTLRIEGHVGGRFIDVTDAQTQTGNTIGEIRVWEPPRLFAFVDQRDCPVVVEFEGVDDGTEVTVTVSGIDQLSSQVAETVRRHSWHTVLRWYVPFAERSSSTPGETQVEREIRFQGVTPNLRYEDAAAAIEWLVRVCGFQERARYVDGDDVVHQAEIYVGDTEVWLSGHGEGYWDNEPAGRGPDQYLVVWTDDVDAQWKRVKAAGVDAPEPVDQDYGVRNFYVTDPGGYHWGFHARLPSGYQQTRPVEEGGLREVLS